MLTVAGKPRWGGNTGYDDEPAEYYSWDSRVQNGRRVAVGDRVVLRDRDLLLGASIIEGIDQGQREKTWRRCPYCGDRNISERATMSPAWKCGRRSCGRVFDIPDEGRELVNVSVARHAAAWTDLYGLMTTPSLKAATHYKDNAPHSIQPLYWDLFTAALNEQAPGALLRSPIARRERRLTGGFSSSTTRVVRRGQGPFRQSLIDAYGFVCAFTGPGPSEALDAAHLYSYADLGEHHIDGGLLLRSDVHALFDAGMLAVTPSDLTIDVDPTLRSFRTYGELHGNALCIAPPDAIRPWLASHWAEHRA